MVLIIKLLVMFIKLWIFFIKHDDDILGDMAYGIIGALKDAIGNYLPENSQT